MSLKNFFIGMGLGSLTEKLIKDKDVNTISENTQKERPYIPERDYIDYEKENEAQKIEKTKRELKAMQDYFKSKNNK